MTGPLVRYAVAEGIATITFARPQAGNAMNMAFMDALYDAASAISLEGRVRAILIEAEGRNFCVGGDLRDFGGEEDAGTYMAKLAGRLHESLKVLAAHSAPLIVAVQGAAAGAGLSLVAGADIALAARSASFVMAYAGIGLTADGGATWLLPRTIGLRRTLDDAVLAVEARAIATRIATGPTAAFGAVKRLLADSGGATFDGQLDDERDAIAAVRTTADAREGIAAFLARRAPEFVGR